MSCPETLLTLTFACFEIGVETNQPTDQPTNSPTNKLTNQPTDQPRYRDGSWPNNKNKNVVNTEKQKHIFSIYNTQSTNAQLYV